MSVQIWKDVIQWMLTAHVLLIGGALLMLALIANMLRQHRSPAASAAWLLFMVAVPYVGVPLYLFFGTRKLASIYAQKAQLLSPALPLSSSTEDPVRNYLQEMDMPPAVDVDRARIHHDAEESADVLRRMLLSAGRSIDICIFILADDALGREILDVLTARAGEGVKVRLLLDGVGSFLLPKRRFRPLMRAGGRVAWFVPVLHRPLRGRTNLRNHRKLVIVDDFRLWSGGRNIARDYLAPEQATRWYDLSFDLAGDGVIVYRGLFEADWSFATGDSAQKLPFERKANATPDAQVQVVPSGPDVAQDVLHDLLVTMISGAQERVLIVTPYFVPGDVLQTILRLAVQRGLRVDLVLPQRSNHRLADIARSRFLRQLAGAGANVWLMPDAMVHAKAVVIDSRYALVGSANLDLRSLFLNFELMTLFYGANEAEQVSAWIEELRGKCEVWHPKQAGAIRETFEGLVLLAAYQL